MICFFRILILLCCTVTLSYAQHDSTLNTSNATQQQPAKKVKEKKSFFTPYNPAKDYQCWGVRFATAIIPVGDDMALPFLLGADVGFLKNNSIGIQGFLYYYNSSNDMAYDTAGVSRGVGDDKSRFERAVMIDYRHYFNLQKMRQRTGICLYTGALARIGKVTKTEDPLYTRTFVSYKEKDYSAAVYIGAMYSPGKAFGYDLNIGYAYKEADITNVYKDHYRVVTEITKPKTFVPRFSLSLYFWLGYAYKNK